MDWKGLVKQVAPVLGTALGGPFGGMATKWLGDKLLGDENADANSLEAFVQTANPDALLKLKELDKAFQLEMERLGLEQAQLEGKDRADARALAKSTTLVPQMVISCIFIIAFAIILYTVFTNSFDMSSSQREMVNYLLGILSAGVVQIMNFWFGSSSGSRQKDAKLHS